MSGKNRRKHKNYKTGRQVLIMIAELLLIFILLIVAFGLYKWSKLGHGRINLKNLEAYKDTGPYTNIVLYGLDARNGEVDKGTNSDTIIIASIKNKTKEVRLLSVYRDCMMQQKDGTYAKANAAYSYGGGEEAIAELNRNLDMDIKNYVSVSFEAMIRAIDAVGGVEVDVQEEEIDYINGYQMEIIKVTGIDSWAVEHPGKQILNGVQATAYSRIRYTEGGDFKRTERQRLVLNEMLKNAKKLSLKELNDLVDEISPLISTSFSLRELLSLAVNINKYELVESKGFPFKLDTANNPGGIKGAFVIPADLESNVKRMHKYLFDNDSYKPSKKVKSISDEIIYMTGVTEEDGFDRDKNSEN